MAPVAQSRIPFRVFHRAVNQRLSCRKITCKAFPFVVEEQRVTSYFLLVKKGGKKDEGKDGVGKRVELSQTLWIYLLYFFFTCGWMLEGCAVPPSGVFPGFIFLRELLGGSGRRRSPRDGARQWKQESKSAAKSAPLGYECFQPRLLVTAASVCTRVAPRAEVTCRC